MRNRLNWIDAAWLLQNCIFVFAKNREAFSAAAVAAADDPDADVVVGTGKNDPQQTRLYLSEHLPGAFGA